jgi:hypothetical protein
MKLSRKHSSYFSAKIMSLGVLIGPLHPQRTASSSIPGMRRS